MSNTNWEADKMLDVYIYDYLMKRKLEKSAKEFQVEAKVSTDPVAIDAPCGFLFEWWSVFWDIFIARTNQTQSKNANSYIETQMMKVREQQQQQQQQQQIPQTQSQHMQMQKLLLQRHAQQQQQQQQREGNLHMNDSNLRQNSTSLSGLGTKMYEDRLNLPLQRDSLDNSVGKQGLDEHMGQLTDPNQAQLLKATTAVGGQPYGQSHNGMSGVSGNIQQAQMRNQQLQDTKMNSRAGGPEGSLIGVNGLNQGGSSLPLPLNGWPLTGLDQLRSGIFQQQKSPMSSSQPFNQLQVQQIMLQAQRNSGPSSSSDLEVRKLKMLLNNQNMGLANNNSLQSVSEVGLNAGLPTQSGFPPIPRGDSDMLIKAQQQQMQQNPHNLLMNQQSQSSRLQQQEKINVAMDTGIPNKLHGNEQASKSQITRKRKQAASSSGPANSSGTGNTTGPSPSSPSSPSTHTQGDVMSMPAGGTSKIMHLYGSEGLGSLASPPNQLANLDQFVDDGTLEDNVESFLSLEDVDTRDKVSVSKGFTFTEIQRIEASTNKIECCDFSADGKLLATGGHDRKAVLWSTDSMTVKSTVDEHAQRVTDVRFSPSMLRLATSSADKTVRVWDIDNPGGYSLRNFTGHSTAVMSVDFHPSKEDFICSCDNNSEIRYWSIRNGTCAGVSKGGATHLRFQPRAGRILAAAADNYISMLDVETQVCVLKLQGHKTLVNSVCWDLSGEYLASVSDDMVRVWKIGSGNKGECIHELIKTGNKFNTCVFHPTYTSLLVIGCYETLELWNMAENKTMTLHAHDKLVSALSVSNATGMVASASHDKFVKLWK